MIPRPTEAVQTAPTRVPTTAPSLAPTSPPMLPPNQSSEAVNTAPAATPPPPQQTTTKALGKKLQIVNVEIIIQYQIHLQNRPGSRLLPEHSQLRVQNYNHRHFFLQKENGKHNRFNKFLT